MFSLYCQELFERVSLPRGVWIGYQYVYTGTNPGWQWMDGTPVSNIPKADFQLTKFYPFFYLNAPYTLGLHEN